MRNLIIIFGDQLDLSSSVFADFDPGQDRIWMAENEHEISYVPSHKYRIVFFLSAMRHFHQQLKKKGYRVQYSQLTEDGRQDGGSSFEDLLNRDIRQLKPEKMICVLPGDYRVLKMLERVAQRHKVPLDILEDTHFYCTREDFQSHRGQRRKSLLMENFYRWMRKTHNILMEDGAPIGRDWNFDQKNRQSFGKEGPPEPVRPRRFEMDEITRDVMDLVQKRYAEHPGSCDDFDLPVDRASALVMLRDFIRKGLPLFGQYQDAMWQGEPFLYHSRLSAMMNVKLINPRECVDKAVEAYENGEVPLASVEGFVRQILGWREYVRGIYWSFMPDYISLNELDHHQDIPPAYWSGETKMACLADAMQTVLRYGYAHHIQRLMVLGLFAQLYGVHPRAFHDWHMAMYCDAIDWVSLPNTLGMSQYGDGGIVGTKPYCASGNYINKMGNYCKKCVYDFKKSSGEEACPFTVLYWDFLDRHYDRLKGNPRLGFAIKNVDRKRRDPEQMDAIRKSALKLKQNVSQGKV